MKLTAEIIESSQQYMNPSTRDRELNLRGYSISVIENLGATMDQFDCIDFSNNDISRLDGFPYLKRLYKLLLSNNRINRIADGLEQSLPNLQWLILTNNNIQQLGDIDVLAKFPRLEFLSLLNNPLVTCKHYRHYLIHRIPQLRILDFRKIKKKERDDAAELFAGEKGQQLEEEIATKSKSWTNKQMWIENKPFSSSTKNAPSSSEVEAIKAAISKAKTLEEIERLNQLLKAGYIPGKSLAI